MPTPAEDPRSALPPLVLGSTSRYRRELLQRLRVAFEVRAPKVAEVPLAGEAPRELALRLARDKALAVAAEFGPAWVIGSDQVCACDGEILGKPGNFERALRQLQHLRGREAVFHTAVALVDPRGEVQLREVPTQVRMRRLDDAHLRAYLLAEQPYDCAGSAKSEGLGIALLDAVRSDDPTALVGLPLIALCDMLQTSGFDLLAAIRT
ncbi:MAG: septum formation protein Maf [Betaproteobacteria bacterium]|nr:septum formation protein Maf [Betaproteobacteria bacterium]